MDAQVSIIHPLDPLSLVEIGEAVAIVKDEHKLGSHHRFVMVRLEEPAKAEVTAWTSGQSLPRLAFALILDPLNGDTFEAIIDLTPVAAPPPLATAAPPALVAVAPAPVVPANDVHKQGEPAGPGEVAPPPLPDDPGVDPRETGESRRFRLF